MEVVQVVLYVKEIFNGIGTHLSHKLHRLLSLGSTIRLGVEILPAMTSTFKSLKPAFRLEALDHSTHCIHIDSTSIDSSIDSMTQGI